MALRDIQAEIDAMRVGDSAVYQENQIDINTPVTLSAANFGNQNLEIGETNGTTPVPDNTDIEGIHKVG